MAIHDLLAARTVVDSKRLQMAMGKVRLASGDFQGRVLAIDPHRVRSYSKRPMRRHRQDEAARPTNVAQTFFVLDADTSQPVCFTTGISARTATAAAEELLGLAADIPRHPARADPRPGRSGTLHGRVVGPGQDADEFRPVSPHARSAQPARETPGIAPRDIPAAMGGLRTGEAGLRRAFDVVPESGPCDLSVVSQEMLRRSELAGFEVTERFYEIGSVTGLAEAQKHLAGQS